MTKLTDGESEKPLKQNLKRKQPSAQPKEDGGDAGKKKKKTKK